MIKITNLTKTFYMPQPLEILKEITLEIQSGEMIGIVGASGAGKSTFLQIIGGLDRPTSGSVEFNGQDLFSLGDDQLAAFRNRHIGFVFQFHHLLPEFTALENTVMPGLIRGLPAKEAETRAADLLEAVGLAERLHHRPGELSGGEQQRVAIARALVLRPDLILADEPTGNLDEDRGESIMALMQKLQEDLKMTFLIVSHNSALKKYADRTLILRRGKLSPT